MGSALKLAGSALASPFGKFHAYEGTFDSTVALLDFGYAPLSAVPTTSGFATNLLRDRMAEVSGQPVGNCDFDVQVQDMTLGFAAAELSSKKGLHVANTQAGAQNASALIGFSLPVGFSNWLLGNMDAGADYAILTSLFLRCTRAQAAGVSAPQSISHVTAFTSATSNNACYLGPSSVSPSSAQAGYLIPYSNLPNIGDAKCSWVGTQGWQGTKPANLNGIGQRRFALMGTGDAWGGFNHNKAASYILYRAQFDIIDLTDLAGADRVAKTQATADRLNAMALRDFGAGGRFADDVFTPAATLMP